MGEGEEEGGRRGRAGEGEEEGGKERKRGEGEEEGGKERKRGGRRGRGGKERKRGEGEEEGGKERKRGGRRGRGGEGEEEGGKERKRGGRRGRGGSRPLTVKCHKAPRRIIILQLCLHVQPQPRLVLHQGAQAKRVRQHLIQTRDAVIIAMVTHTTAWSTWA